MLTELSENPSSLLVGSILHKTLGLLDLVLGLPNEACTNFRKGLDQAKTAKEKLFLEYEYLEQLKYEILLMIVRWMMKQGDHAFAAEIVYFASMYQDYSRFFYFVISEYTTRLEELTNFLSPEELQISKKRAETRELDSTLDELLSLLEREGNN